VNGWRSGEPFDSSCGMQDYRKLIVWQKARRLAVRVNEATEKLVHRDRSGFVSQVRRAALSIPSNITEGCSRPTNNDLAKFIQIAIASTSELDFQLQFGLDTNRISAQEGEALRQRAIEIRRMLYGLLSRVREPQKPRPKPPPPKPDQSN
jgi:four helix bundle protein